MRVWRGGAAAAACLLGSCGGARGLQHSAAAATPRVRARATAASASAVPLPSLPTDRHQVLALDFDGVICASSGESSYTSVLAACSFWPKDVVVPLKSQEFATIQAGVHQLRPIVETGYENMLLVRRLYDEMKKTGKSPDVASLLGAWSPVMRDELLAAYGSDKETMIRVFGAARDALIAQDLDFWVRLNEVYPWALAAMRQQPLDYTIVTTKQARFVEAILTQNRIAPPNKDKLFDLENPFGPKTRVLQAMLRGLPATSTLTVQQMLDTPLLPPSARPMIHFVEDRVETLQAILQVPELRDNTKLYLVEHGYNTAEQRALARQSGGAMQLISPNTFQELLGQFTRSGSSSG